MMKNPESIRINQLKTQISGCENELSIKLQQKRRLELDLLRQLAVYKHLKKQVNKYINYANALINERQLLERETDLLFLYEYDDHDVYPAHRPFVALDLSHDIRLTHSPVEESPPELEFNIHPQQVYFPQFQQDQSIEGLSIQYQQLFQLINITRNEITCLLANLNQRLQSIQLKRKEITIYCTAILPRLFDERHAYIISYNQCMAGYYKHAAAAGPKHTLMLSNPPAPPSTPTPDSSVDKDLKR